MKTNKPIEEMASQCYEKYTNEAAPHTDPYFATLKEIDSAFSLIKEKILDFAFKEGCKTGAAAQKELSDKREVELMAVIEECKKSLLNITITSSRDKASYDASITLTNINEKLEKLNGK